MAFLAVADVESLTLRAFSSLPLATTLSPQTATIFGFKFKVLTADSGVTVLLAAKRLSWDNEIKTGLFFNELKRLLPLIKGVRRISGSCPPSNQLGILPRAF